MSSGLPIRILTLHRGFSAEILSQPEFLLRKDYNLPVSGLWRVFVLDLQHQEPASTLPR